MNGVTGQGLPSSEFLEIDQTMPRDPLHQVLIAKFAESYPDLDEAGRKMFADMLKPGAKIRILKIKQPGEDGDKEGSVEFQVDLPTAAMKQGKKKAKTKKKPKKKVAARRGPWVKVVQGGAPGLGKRA